MKWLRIVIGSLIVLLLLACQFLTSITQEPDRQTQDPGSQGESPGESSKILDIPADPVQIAVTTDPSYAVEAVVSLDGGELTANGADGTVYHLVIPPNSLQFETQITMTPVAAINGLPFGDGQSYAVQLAPEGLFLYESAVLTITPAQPEQARLYVRR